MKDLLVQYKKSRRGINEMINNLGNNERDKMDRTYLNSMKNELSWIIEWIDSGSNPEELRGINTRYAYDISYLSNMDVLPDIVEQIERKPLELTKEQKTVLIKVFDALSDRERDCFILHTTQDVSMNEIANELKISKASVQSYINRAREKVKEVVELSVPYG